MNREFNPTSKVARSILAIVAALSTVLIFGSIEAIAQHYSSETQSASAPSMVIARR